MSDSQTAAERLQALKELKDASTKVVAWYAHPGQVRGPYNRWFEVTTVESKYESEVASKANDAAYAAAAMNEVPWLIEHIAGLQKEIANLKDEYHDLELAAERAQLAYLVKDPKVGFLMFQLGAVITFIRKRRLGITPS